MRKKTVTPTCISLISLQITRKMSPHSAPPSHLLLIGGTCDTGGVFMTNRDLFSPDLDQNYLWMGNRVSQPTFSHQRCKRGVYLNTKYSINIYVLYIYIYT